MQLTSDFKNSDVGSIPVDWDCVAIADVARLESGHTPSKRVPTYWDGDIPWVSLHDSQALEANEIHETANSITELGLQNSSARLLPAGTVVFSRTATVGKACIIARPMATSQDFANYVCGPRLHNRYLMYLFRFMRPRWRRLMAGSIHNTIYMPVFETLQIVCPPIHEQVAIAEVLADFDSQIDATLRFVEKKRNLKQAVMQQLLSGRTRVLSSQIAWEQATLGELAVIRNCKVIASHAKPGMPCIDLDSLESASGRLLRYFTPEGSSPKYTFRRGDVLFGRLRAYLRKYWQASFDGLCSTEIWPLTPRDQRLDSRFLRAIVQTDAMIDAASVAYGTHMPRADWSVVKELPVLLPPIDEQAAIADIFDDMDAEIDALEARLEKTRALKQAMMQELLTGRTRLV